MCDVQRAGRKRPFVIEKALEEHHEVCLDACMQQYDSVRVASLPLCAECPTCDSLACVFVQLARFGSKDTIADFRRQLKVRLLEWGWGAHVAAQASVTNSWLDLEDANKAKNPLMNVDKYLVPLVIAATAYVLANLLYLGCPSDFGACTRLTNSLRFVYTFVFFLAFLMALSSGRVVVDRLKDVVSTMVQMRTFVAKPKRD